MRYFDTLMLMLCMFLCGMNVEESPLFWIPSAIVALHFAGRILFPGLLDGED
jgi:hypothetical protein